MKRERRRWVRYFLPSTIRRYEHELGELRERMEAVNFLATDYLERGGGDHLGALMDIAEVSEPRGLA